MMQAELLLLLAASDSEQTDWQAVSPVPGKLFVVGFEHTRPTLNGLPLFRLMLR